MAIHFTRKKQTVDKNTADPWRIFGATNGEGSKADSQKTAHEIRQITEEVPSLPVEESVKDSKG